MRNKQVREKCLSLSSVCFCSTLAGVKSPCHTLQSVPAVRWCRCSYFAFAAPCFFLRGSEWAAVASEVYLLAPAQAAPLGSEPGSGDTSCASVLSPASLQPWHLFCSGVPPAWCRRHVTEQVLALLPRQCSSPHQAPHPPFSCPELLHPLHAPGPHRGASRSQLGAAVWNRLKRAAPQCASALHPGQDTLWEKVSAGSKLAWSWGQCW